MSDPTESPEAPAPQSRALTLPDFTPVPRRKDRSNGWKPEVQRQFIEALADTGSVTAACARVHRSDHGAYALRRHPEAAEFRRAWDAALDLGVRRIEDGVMDRAINGVQVPVYSKGGELVGHRTVHNERLTTFILQNRAPERFGGLRSGLDGKGGAKGPNAVDKMELHRLKQQWEAEREAAERDDYRANYPEIRKSLCQKLTAWRIRMLDELRDELFEQSSPELQELWNAFEQARDAERAARGDLPIPRLAAAAWREPYDYDDEGDDADGGEEAEWEDVA